MRRSGCRSPSIAATTAQLYMYSGMAGAVVRVGAGTLLLGASTTLSRPQARLSSCPPFLAM